MADDNAAGLARQVAAIEVLELHPVDKGALRAFAKVKIGCVVVHSCRIVQQPGQKPWVALPQQPARTRSDGSGAGWFPLVEIVNPSVLARIKDAILDAWEAQR